MRRQVAWPLVLGAVTALALVAGFGHTYATAPDAASGLDPARLQGLLRAGAFGDLDDALLVMRRDLLESAGSEEMLIVLFEDAATSDAAIAEGLRAWHQRSSVPCVAGTARAIVLLYRAERAWGGELAIGQVVDLPAEVRQLRDDARRLLTGAMAMPDCAIAHVVAQGLIPEQEARSGVERALRDAPDSVLLLGLSIPTGHELQDPDGLVPDDLAARLSPIARRALATRLAVRQATRLARDERIVDAAQWFEHGINSSSNPADLRARATFFERLGWRADALRDYEAALDLDPHFRPAHLALALEAVAGEDAKRAEAHIKMLLEIDPDDPDALQLIAKVYLLRDEPDLAVESLQKALQVGTHRAEILAQLGELRIEHRQDLDQSIAYFEAAIELAPDDGRYAVAAAMARCLKAKCWLLWELQELDFLCREHVQCGAGIADIVARSAVAEEDPAGVAVAEELGEILGRIDSGARSVGSERS